MKLLSAFKFKKTFLLAFALVAVMAITATSAFASTPPEDTPVSMANINLPFSVVGMLGTATNFLAIYGPWILLALGVVFSPVLYGLALRLVSYAKSKLAVK